MCLEKVACAAAACADDGGRTGGQAACRATRPAWRMPFNQQGITGIMWRRRPTRARLP